MAKKEKTFPNRTFEQAARDAGAQVMCLWQMEGPRNTDIAWIEMFLVDGALAEVHSYKTPGVWNVFTPGNSINVDETIKDAMARCGRPQAPPSLPDSTIAEKVKAYNDRLNKLEIAPTGEHYNRLLDIIEGASS